MKLHQLKRSSWLKNKAKQRGRGNGTGTGNYSGSWLKWQKARSWHSMKAFFEWGQTSIIQRLPKARGFKKPFKLIKEVSVINLWILDQDTRIFDTMELTKAMLKDLGYIKHATDIVKVLWDGDYNKHIKFVDIDLFSKSAQEKIANPKKSEGGKVKLQTIKTQKIEKEESKKIAKEKKASEPKVKKVAAVVAPKAVKKVVVKKTVVKKTIKKESE